MIVLLSIAILTALLVTPFVRKIFIHYGIVDKPDGWRKLHVGLIPRVGGITIVASYLAAFGAFALLHHNWTAEIFREKHQILWLVPPAAIIFFVGLCDDLFGMKAWPKLAIQIFAASMAVCAGLRVDSLFYHPMNVIAGTIVTVFWIVLCTNAFNLIDGMDGLATGIGLFATLTVMCVGWWTGNAALMFATVPLAGALLGFLYFNFSPASVFLGDSGSYTIGFLLGCFGVIWSQKSTTALGMVAPALAFTVPLLDVWLSVVRRFLRMKPVFEPDHGHIHHKLLALGLTTRRAAMALYGLTVLCATLALALSFGHHRWGGIVITAFCLVILWTVGALRYEELRLALILLWPREFRLVLNSRLKLQSAKRRMHAARSPIEQWAALQDTCSDLGFCSVRLEGARGDLRSFTEVEREQPACFGQKCETCARSCTVSARIDGETSLYLRYGLDNANTHLATIFPLVTLVRETLFMGEHSRTLGDRPSSSGWKTEHAVKMESGALVAMALQTADFSEPPPEHQNKAEAGLALAELPFKENSKVKVDGIEELVADKEYNSGAVLSMRKNSRKLSTFPRGSKQANEPGTETV
jgi:UDP-GlcNAc:undecaprenyl-phosphate GlcNAc-1-phosphate transferase